MAELGIVEQLLEDQGALEPGQDGYWKVFGAMAYDVQQGDLVMVGWKDRETGETGVDQYQVAALAPREDQPFMDQVRPRFRSPSGEFFTIGALQPIQLVRWGTHHVLAKSVR